MGNIILLDEGTANRIAAGEVVERPSSVVKELVENSLDAGAAVINVDIKKGGISSIVVSDDGEGLHEDDVLLAFERHATSKLRTAEDLERVLTLGFRGEALPSIASVSKVRLTTRRRGADYGRLVEIHGGRLVRDEAAGCPFGTAVSVTELFYNLPARYKFLKKDTAEAAQVSELMGKFAIGKPGISFSLTTQNARLLHTQGGGKPEDAVYAVLGKDIYAGLAPVSRPAGDADYSITGFIGKPETARANRNYQFFYINGRMIKNRTIYSAVEEAYKSHLPGKRYPVAILYINTDAALVDVNAHPAKTEVRFWNEGDLFRAVYRAVGSALQNMGGRAAGAWRERLSATESIFGGAEMPVGNTGIFSGAGDARENAADFIPGAVGTQANEAGPPAEERALGQPPLFTPEYISGPQTPDNNPAFAAAPVTEATVINNISVIDNIPSLSEMPPATGRETSGVISREDVTPDAGRQKARYIGQFFNTYLAFEKGELLILVDQHAAHERALYEQIKAQYKKRAIARQPLLESVTVNLLPDEMLFIREHDEFFIRAGFQIEEFGQEAVIIRETPIYLERPDIKAFFLETLETVRRDSNLRKNAKGAPALPGYALYAIACKAAIKGNRRLSPMEAEALYRVLDALPKPLTCPHGRPLTVPMQKRDFDKMFRRI